MHTKTALEEKKVEAFSLSRFLVINTFNFAFLTALFWAVSTLAANWMGISNRFWAAQFTADWRQYAAAFLVLHLLTCFVEYFFHRYVLHKHVIPFLHTQYRAHHLIHHPSTRIGKKRKRGGGEVLFLIEIENDYPITRPEQNEAAFFPGYSMLVFALALAPVLALLQWLFPTFPWFLMGNVTLFFSLTLYEVFHSIEHWPFESWVRLIEHPRWGKFWTKVYGFHLRHHAVIDCNEAISGFFLLPIADWFFGTYVPTKTLYASGEEWSEKHFTHPTPRWPIPWFDRWAKEMELRNRFRARAK